MSGDPNRYADPLEAVSLRARLADEEAELDVVCRKREHADLALEEAETRFREAEAQFNRMKTLRDDCAAYAKAAAKRQVEQLAVVATQRAFFHPVRKVPLEILGEIFEQCLVRADNMGTYSTSDSLNGPADHSLLRRRQPFALAQVCKQWRQACLRSPRAWAYIEVLFDQVTTATASKYSSYLKLIIARSQSATLVVRLHRTRRTRDQDARLVSKIVLAMERCRTLQIDVDSVCERDALLPILTSRAPSLVYAFLKAADPKSTKVVENVPLLPDATHLRVLTGRHIFCAGPTSLPALRVAHLSMAKCTPKRDDVTHLLRTSPLLESLNLYSPTFKAREGPEPEVITAPCLRDLSLHNADISAKILAQKASFPVLSQINIFGDATSSSSRIALLPWLWNSSRFIDDPLRLNGIMMNDIADSAWPAFILALRDLTSMAHITISKTSFTPTGLCQLCDALSQPGGGEGRWLCPRLYALYFLECTLQPGCRGGDVLRFVKARVEAAALAQGPQLMHRVTVGWKGDGDLQSEINQVLREGSAALSAAED
ncbi:hypothetical protein EXIGLDRAFT_716447 [Exidia glandulosa HHB12029]|uniref:F-box domain-containing protein n=1 Tax=Exidia glandulosa HHB12029 TaxID=1314781 RepID=A0A165P8J2_EXIGL|nr:hypothetical protein EXIGLDRAFT_716447 [Exidia glandulosa HHB12029]